ncbi:MULTISPECIES: molybdopterin oxidoreductase family protein [unclassified Bacillus (in: firmicutes)]|uniref:molybdopterin oxidoreductase family protein n=1 Tax=unclassified Bacillus (in: firmicutes) TaxID=185979 RepID=UPI001BE7E4F7|nr:MULTISPECIES: molybdopterin oxidoreductase family protein [unclassified Bacillus (in: firmicutes)]MBT2614149.1 molybdopterin oxidoreductase family protein [Bacillus sp. ISL-78]MBT2629340.1 molybdopterin oxidoreductase family protein [Bacillus sp. ISL-101]MBT2718502.1 molybdopterin oxidoreductase family protein [Bacillus sp. ISL-57]
MQSYINQPDGVFPSVCSLDCPDQCGLLLHKKDGKIIKVQGDPDHPVTKGNICNKVRNMTARLYDPNRLKQPLKRIGPKGKGNFVPISWEEAIDTITSKWKDLIETHGPESILPYSFYGNMGNLSAEGMDRRFFHKLGASMLERSICNAAGSVGYSYTMGGSFGIDPEETIHTKLFIMWGINAVSTNMHQVTLAQQARKNGAKVVVIDVHKNQTGKWADWFIPILPGTDSALALGLMHILYAENLVDQPFLDEYTVGAAELREHVRQYDPATVSAITGVPIDDLYELARMYGTTSPSFVRIGNGLQHHDNGGMAVRTIACLPALTGQWMEEGGGAIKGNSGYLAFNINALRRPDLLHNKATRTINMNQIGQALMEKENPIRSMFVYGSNPALVAPNANKVQEGLMREDLFTVVHDLFLTETAIFADLVLPATSSYETEDFYNSYWHNYVQIQKPVVEKYGESKSNVELFKLLAAGMGFGEQAFRDSEEDMIRQALDFPDNPHLEGITYDSLSRNQFVKAKMQPMFPGKLPTPSGKIELYSERMKRDGYEPLPTYTPIIKDSDLPFLFIPAPNHNFLNSTFSNNAKHISMEKEPKLHMNAADAKTMGIAAGDMVRIWNGRGECLLTAAPGENVLQGVLVSQGLWQNTPETKQHINSLTPDRLSDMGNGAVFFSGRVDLEKVQQ